MMLGEQYSYEDKAIQTSTKFRLLADHPIHGLA